jgi:UDP-N-acetylglucosamine 2-epimerase (non-hydrolysing)
MIKIDLIAGARPNFIKISPIIEAINEVNSTKKIISFRLIHTGQHFDKNMSDTFFSDLGIPKPDINLNAGGGSQAEQTSKIMIGYEKVLLDDPTQLCLVVGDVTSTMACSIVAKKMGIKVAHVEAGIRSGDKLMPEEINRIVTDSISDYFFTTSVFANTNLLSIGIKKEVIFFVGNTMIDTLLKNIPNFRKPNFWDTYSLTSKKYLVLTLHRPSNVDDKGKLEKIINDVLLYSENNSVVFPVHPRTKKLLDEISFKNPRLYCVNPMSYLEFNFLVKNSLAVITDSGGITEETTVMGIPCMTLRDSTERPETCSIGTNELLGNDSSGIKAAFNKLFTGNWKNGGIPELWDGKASKRIISSLIEIFK